MAPPQEQGKPGWLKLATACYYCLASMTVQFMNKVIDFLVDVLEQNVFQANTFH